MTKRGIVCPECGCGDTNTKVTRPSGDKIRRRRVCRGCGFRFSTVEVVVGFRKPLQIDKQLTAEEQIALNSEKLKTWFEGALRAQRSEIMKGVRRVLTGEKLKRERVDNPRMRVVVPDWVPPLYALAYVEIARKDGEEVAAAHIRKLKNNPRR